jgi:hypothetical protein
MKINLGTKDNPQMIKVQLTQENMSLLKELLMEYKDIFSWMYKNLKGKPPIIGTTSTTPKHGIHD